jgi:hypothetical protein
MKLLASILALHILMLVSVDTLMANYEVKKEHSCCKVKNEQNHKKDHKKNCCGKGCNPFVSCCSMMGFIPQSQTLTFKKPLITKEKIALRSENVLSVFTGEAWNPPKV